MIGRLGEGPYKGLYSLVSAVGLVLIVWGFSRYRSAGYIQVWNPPFALFHPIALVLLWFAFVALVSAYAPPSKIKATLRHPMLVAVKAWALSHLLVNGDLGSMLLFGALLAWAVYDRIAAKRRGDAAGAPPVAGFGRNECDRGRHRHRGVFRRSLDARIADRRCCRLTFRALMGKLQHGRCV